MKTTLNAKNIRAAVKFVMGAIPRRTTLPILSNVPCYANGHFEMTATDLDITLQARAESQTAHEGIITIPARALLDASAGKESFELETGDNSAVTFRNGANVRSVASLPAEEFPPLPVMPENIRHLEFPAEKFTAALRAVSLAQSTDETRYVLNGVKIELATDCTRFVATDGRRLHIAELASGNLDAETWRAIAAAEMAVEIANGNLASATAELAEVEKQFPPQLVPFNPAGLCSYCQTTDVAKAGLWRKQNSPETVAANARVIQMTDALDAAKKQLAKIKTGSEILLPAKAVKAILSIPLDKKDPGVLTLANWEQKFRSGTQADTNEPQYQSIAMARVDCGAYVVITKQIEGNYPNFRQVIPAEIKERVQVIVAEFAAAVATAEKATSEKSNSVKLHFTKNNLRITGKSESCGEASAQVAINYPGNEFEIAFNPRYLLSACEAFAPGEEMAIEWIDELSPIKIVNRHGLSAVIMPMRLS